VIIHNYKVIFHIHDNDLTSCNRILLHKLIGAQPVKKSPPPPPILWNPKGHYYVHKSPLQDTVIRQLNSVYTPHPISVRSTVIFPSHLPLDLSLCLFPSRFPTKIVYAFLISPMRATCLTRLILIQLLIVIPLGEEYNLRISSLCSFLHPLATFSLTRPKYYSTFFLKYPQYVTDQVSHS
jgi:hypothetical protein